MSLSGPTSTIVRVCALSAVDYQLTSLHLTPCDNAAHTSAESKDHSMKVLEAEGVISPSASSGPGQDEHTTRVSLL